MSLPAFDPQAQTWFIGYVVDPQTSKVVMKVGQRADGVPPTMLTIHYLDASHLESMTQLKLRLPDNISRDMPGKAWAELLIHQNPADLPTRGTHAHMASQNGYALG